MKKVIVVVMATIAGMAISSGSFAQGNATKMRTSKLIQIDGRLSAATSGGVHTVNLPDGKGTLKFTKTGDKYSNVVFTDAAGKVHNLQPTKPGTGGAPQPSCKYPLPDACFGTADKSIGLCMCKPTDLAANPDSYSIAMLLPAVQKVREAAQK